MYLCNITQKRGRKIGNDCVYVQMSAPKNETEVSSKPKKQENDYFLFFFFFFLLFWLSRWTKVNFRVYHQSIIRACRLPSQAEAHGGQRSVEALTSLAGCLPLQPSVGGNTSRGLWMATVKHTGQSRRPEELEIIGIYRYIYIYI